MATTAFTNFDNDISRRQVKTQLSPNKIKQIDTLSKMFIIHDYPRQTTILHISIVY